MPGHQRNLQSFSESIGNLEPQQALSKVSFSKTLNAGGADLNGAARSFTNSDQRGSLLGGNSSSGSMNGRTTTGGMAGAGAGMGDSVPPPNLTASMLPGEEDESAPISDASLYTWPGVLRFMQLEWRDNARIKLEQEIEIEKMKSRIDDLEGTNRALKAINIDALRRIRMLELALQQERKKQNAGGASKTLDVFQLDLPEPSEAPKQLDFPLGVTKTRQILRQCLAEIGAIAPSQDDAHLPPLPDIPFPAANLASSPSHHRHHHHHGHGSRHHRSRGSSYSGSTSSSASGGSSSGIEEGAEEGYAPLHRKNGPGAANLLARQAGPPPEEHYYPAAGADGKLGFRKEDTARKLPPMGGHAAPDSVSSPFQSGFAEDDLDELSSMDVGVGEEAKSPTKTSVSGEKGWRSKYTLRGHLDVVRAVAFHPDHERNNVLSASDDGTIKVWDLDKLGQAQKSVDLEPLITHRGHHGPVTSLATALLPPTIQLPNLPNSDAHTKDADSIFLSGGLDATVRVWRFAPSKRPPYPPYDHEHYALATLVGHTDAVWSLTTLPHPITPMFASSSADGTIRLWDIAAALQTSASAALKHVIQVKKLCNATPTSVRGGWTEGQVVVGRSDGKISLFDVAGGASKEACVLQGNPFLTESRDHGDHPNPEQCNALAVHPTDPLVVTAHEDRSVRLYDTRTGQCEYSMVAHLDAVGSIDYSADGRTVITGGHDSSVRFWNFSAAPDSKAIRSCIQEFTAHRQKYDEGVCSVAMRHASGHPSDTSTWAASGGGDSLVKIMTST